MKDKIKSSISSIRNSSGPSKVFVFKDVHGEAERITAESVEDAWKQLSDNFSTSVEDIKGMGIKLVPAKENALSDEEIYKGVMVTYHGDGSLEFVDEDNFRISKGPVSGGKKEAHAFIDKWVSTGRDEHAAELAKRYKNSGDGPSDDDVQSLAWSKFKQNWDGLSSRQQEEIYAELGFENRKNSKMDTPCPGCKLPMRMRPEGAPADGDQYRCGNRRCAEFRTADGQQSSIIRDKKNSLDIDRNVRSLLRENGIDKGSTKYGTRKNYETEDQEYELGEQIRILTRKYGKVDQVSAKKMAQDIMEDAKGDLKKWIDSEIGNTFDLQHYIENNP